MQASFQQPPKITNLIQIQRVVCASLLLGISLTAIASATDKLSPFYMGASAGYNTLDGTHDETDGIVGRLVFGAEGYQTGQIIWGVELGAESGNDVRLDAPPDVDCPLCSPVEATLEPAADLLLTARMHTTTHQPWGVFLKAGAAYRDLRLLYISSDEDNIQQIAPEVQAGLSYQATHHARFVLYYQGIYAEDDAGVHLDDDGNTTIEDIPTQQAGFFGLEYRL